MEKIIDFVRNELKHDKSGHGINHAMRVFNNAKKIMAVEGGNEKVVLTAALVHDTIDEKLFSNQTERITILKNFLAQNNYNKDEIDEIIYIITNISWHEGHFSDISSSKHAQIVRDADRLDAIGAMGIIRTISFGVTHNRDFYEEENITQKNGKFCFNKPTYSTLSHFYQKLLILKDYLLTDTAKKLAEKKQKFMEQFLEEFYDEL